MYLYYYSSKHKLLNNLDNPSYQTRKQYMQCYSEHIFTRFIRLFII